MGCKLFSFCFVPRQYIYRIEIVFDDMFAFIVDLFWKGAWQNIFRIWKNILRNRLAEVPFIGCLLVYMYFLALNDDPGFC